MKQCVGIKIKKLNENAKIPTRGTNGAAGYDLYACMDEDIVIESHKSVLVPTGLAMALPEGYYAAIVARSGLAIKQGLRLANCYAVCDEDYRGEYFIPLYNDSAVKRVIHSGDRVAQMLIKKYEICTFQCVDELDATDRGANGFGSTGIN